MADDRRLAFLGIGHPLRGDDALGPELCERLRPPLRGRSDVLIVNGGPAPENCIGELRAFAPARVIVIDAARMGEPPGTLRLIEPTDPRAAGASTHTLPLPVFCRYLEETLGCDVILLGIEPADTSFGEGLSPEVERAVSRAVSDTLTQLVDPFDAAMNPRPHDSLFPRKRESRVAEASHPAPVVSEAEGFAGATAPVNSAHEESPATARHSIGSGKERTA